jgi:toxin ParE1/3/4
MTPIYRLSPLAQQDIEDIAFHIALDDHDAAQRLVRQLCETFSLLASQPELGRLRTEIGRVRSLAVRPYVVFYRPRGRIIEIVRVVHGARDIASLLGDFDADKGAEKNDD